METEPDTREMIQMHMKQLEPVLRKYKEQIFVIQGLFVGDCGEMHDSKFLSEEDMQILATQLSQVTDEETFLAVRTPEQWRRITGISSPEQVGRGEGTLASRLGLFNDGMLGSESDYGTYGGGTLEDNGPLAKWNREQELIFQNTLCRNVPIGGEVIVENPYNDLENALRDMAAMHVTYINRDYDSEVLNKWKETLVTASGCFDGMDGLSYIERHLGYRLVIRNTNLEYISQEDTLSVTVAIQNVGFAPVYKEAEVRMVLCREDGSELYSRVIPQDIRELAGGSQSSQLLEFHTAISLKEIAVGKWNIFFEISEIGTGQRILLGNEQEPGKYGYLIGFVEKTRTERDE